MQEKFKIIIGPAKTFNKVQASLNSRPQYLQQAKTLFAKIKPWKVDEIKKRYQISDKLANRVFTMHQNHGQAVYNAIEVFGGTVFKQLDLEKYDKKWLNEHVMIIDPLYGMIKPYQTIGLYRLDMKTKIDIDLVSYWRPLVHKTLKNYKVYLLCAQEWMPLLQGLNLHPILLDQTIKQIKVARGKRLHQILATKKI